MIVAQFSMILLFNASSVFHLQHLSSDPTCYEPIDDNFREKAKFWLEGIGILVVGICGLTGNLLSVFVLRRSRGNQGFHTLLIM